MFLFILLPFSFCFSSLFLFCYCFCFCFSIFFCFYFSLPLVFSPFHQKKVYERVKYLLICKVEVKNDFTSTFYNKNPTLSFHTALPSLQFVMQLNLNPYQIRGGGRSKLSLSVWHHCFNLSSDWGLSLTSFFKELFSQAKLWICRDV